MQAYVVNQPGGPEALQLTTLPKPNVKPGWTRVKVLGFGINHSEIFTREGKSPSVQFPRVLGIEVVGVVDETSAPATFTSGQRVVSIMGEMGRAYDGSYAEYVLLPNEQVYPIKTDLPIASLVATPETYYTAYGIFKSLQLKATDRVLNGCYLTGFSSGDVSQTLLQDLFDFIAAYHVSVAPARIFNFNQVPAAHAYLQAADSFGKAIVLLDQNAE